MRASTPTRTRPRRASSTIDVGTDWQQFSFTVYEGWDYFADRSKLIMLTFIATRDQTLEKTLWIDDVVADPGADHRRGGWSTSGR